MIYLLLFFGSLFASEIELFCDYAWDAKGQTMFPISEQDQSLLSQIRKQLLKRGDEIRSWEIEKYRPALLNWNGVKNLTDFAHWLGFGVIEKNVSSNVWVFWNLGPKIQELNLAKVPKEKLFLVMWEPPSVQKELYDPKIQALFGKILTWDDDLVDNKKFFKLHYPAIHPRISEIVPFEEKKFCVMIARRLTSDHPKELYSERRRAIKFFEEKSEGEFDLFGYNWKKKKYKNYQGSVADKIGKLKEYKFSICYENTGNVKGYISEKIFDCFTAGVVPIYLGASNVTDYIPANCFIDKRNFANYEDLYQFLKSMTQEEYQGYLERAEKFLSSEKAKVFTDEYFIEQFISLIEKP
jgi:hypothetical protein